MQRVKIGDEEFVIKKITPADFLDEPAGIPISIIQGKKGKTMYDQAIELDSNPSKKEREKQREIELKLKVISRSVISHNEDTFNIEVIKGNNYIIDQLFAVIVDISCTYFKTLIDVSSNNALIIDGIAHRYGKAPIEVLLPLGGYSDLEAYIINSYVYVEAIRHENKRNKRQW